MSQKHRIVFHVALILCAAIILDAQVATVGQREMTPLMRAAAFGDLQAVKELVKTADVNTADSSGMTALMYGVRDSAKVDLLLANDADPNVKTRQGQTALLIAASNAGSMSIVRALVAKGADPKITGPAGRNGLTLAAGANDFTMVQYFVEKGIDVNSSYRSDKEGFTALMAASAQLNAPMARYLLEKGADVNRATFGPPSVKNGPLALNGLTALMMAVPNGSPELVKTLLDARANVSRGDVRGMTPLMFAVAAENQDPAVVKLLVEAGSDLKAKDIYGDTAADWARKYGYPSTLALLNAPSLPKTASVPNLPPIPESMELKKIIEDSTALLQRTTKQFSSAGGCAACHAQHFTAMAVTAARRKGIRVNEVDASELMRSMSDGLRARQISMLQRLDSPGIMAGTLYTMSLLEDAKYPADDYTASAVVFLISRQFADGHWPREDESRSPLDDGDMNRTALSVAAIQAYAPASMRAEANARIARAQKWMLSVRPKNTDDQAMLLYGLSRSRAERKNIQDAAKALLALQRPDGGWAPNANLQSDAYVTGQALWALSETGTLAVGDPAYRKAVQYLLRTREIDGSWRVPSRAPKFQPYFESGFPHGHDQWISAAGTARAVVALSRFVD